MAGLGNQRYQARIGSTPEDRRAAQQLRARAFLGGGQELDCDRFDDICTHVLIEETGSGTLVCCFRMLVLATVDYYDICGKLSFSFFLNSKIFPRLELDLCQIFSE